MPGTVLRATGFSLTHLPQQLLVPTGVTFLAKEQAQGGEASHSRGRVGPGQARGSRPADPGACASWYVPVPLPCGCDYSSCHFASRKCPSWSLNLFRCAGSSEEGWLNWELRWALKMDLVKAEESR